ncbi:MAG TPA: MarR family winged helix-turn-helix transcriptional regulator [Streptosporangiaceae bacterium]
MKPRIHCVRTQWNPGSSAVGRVRQEQLGLASRGEAAHDRRVKTASVTEQGHRMVEAINAGRRRILDEAFAGWSEHDRAELARLTRRFADDIFTLVNSLAPGPP